MNQDVFLKSLQSVTTIPLIPYHNGEINLEAHQKNIQYLMKCNVLDDDLERVICIAGTSLIHHTTSAEKTTLVRATGEVMQNDGVLISALTPNPLQEMGAIIEEQYKLSRPPDGFLIMPVAGVYSPEGLFHEIKSFCNQYGEAYGAKFIFYHRQPRDQDAIIRLVNDCEHMVGIKVGTAAEDVPGLVEGIGESGLVIWGIGDRSTKAAKLGSTGHTSGISVIYAKAGDMINNAQRSGDYETALQIEKRISPLEELRFRQARAYNYAAVHAAMQLAGFSDIDAGEGGPFNPPLTGDVLKEVEEAIAGLDDLH